VSTVKNNVEDVRAVREGTYVSSTRSVRCRAEGEAASCQNLKAVHRWLSIGFPARKAGTCQGVNKSCSLILKGV
jgi:hypothetical protein